MALKKEYDAVVIGAGIGGLVCGCYLAKAGMKVLIVEKNAKPGGCCSSFSKGGYTFDACAHFLGSLRKEGIITKIMDGLNINESIEIRRQNPSDVIISKDYKYSFWNNIEETIDELSGYFPAEKDGIKEFINYVLNVEGYKFLELRNKTLKDLFDFYLTDNKLKALLGFPILGNVGLPPSQVSAIKTVTIFKEFMLDGGYYIPGGIQILPDTLARAFITQGGALNLGSPVKRIIIENNQAHGIITEQDEFIKARYIISNADAYHTFFSLIGSESLPSMLKMTLKKLKPSLSMFTLYLGTRKIIPPVLSHSHIWYLNDYNLEKMYKEVLTGDVKNIKWFFGYCDPETKTILCFCNVPYISEKYWRENKTRIVELLIEKIERILPNTGESISFKEVATPETIFRWTSNYKGAAYGWAGTIDQYAVSGLSQIPPIKNLFLAGHWTTQAHGVSGVMYVGSLTARFILNINNKRNYL